MNPQQAVKVVGKIFIIEVHLVTLLLLTSVQPADKHPKFMEVEAPLLDKQQRVGILRFE